MPTYQYKCPKCGHDYDKLQNINDNSKAKCPKCGTRGGRVIVGGAGLIFKGSGFYLTDYGRSGQSKQQSETSGGGDKKEKPAESAPKAAEKSADKPAEKSKAKPKTKGDS